MVRLLPLLAACLLATGCFVFDELDKGQEILEQHSPKAAAGPAQSTPAEQAGPKTGSTWWSSARSLGTAPGDASADDPNAAVACRVGGSTRFMRRGDCLSQGGRPTS